MKLIEYKNEEVAETARAFKASHRKTPRVDIGKYKRTKASNAHNKTSEGKTNASQHI